MAAEGREKQFVFSGTGPFISYPSTSSQPFQKHTLTELNGPNRLGDYYFEGKLGDMGRVEWVVRWGNKLYWPMEGVKE